MTDFDHILNWRLLKGSHEFPGPNGGTCINEAAVIAAGFEYRQVKSWKDCPPCFSPVVATFAIVLNDRMSDEFRQMLIPFVTRMSGTARGMELEVERCKFLSMRAASYADAATAAAYAAAAAADAATAAAYAAARDAADAAYAATAAAYAAARDAADATARAAAYAAAADAAADAADAAADAADAAAAHSIWQQAIQDLDHIINMGHTEVPLEQAIRRLELAKQRPRVEWQK